MKKIIVFIVFLFPLSAYAQRSLYDERNAGVEDSINYEKLTGSSYGELEIYYPQPNARTELTNNWDDDKLDFRNWFVEFHGAEKEDLRDKAKLSSLLPTNILEYVLSNWGKQVANRNFLGCGYIYIYYKYNYFFVGCWTVQRDSKKLKMIYGLI